MEADSLYKKRTEKPVKEQVDSLVSSGVISPESRKVLNSLMFLVNIGNYLPLLQFKVACAMHLCNQYGVMAGVSGGNSSGGFATPLAATEYRKSKASSPPPSINLPTDQYAIASACSVSSSVPSYDDKPASANYNNIRYRPYPIYMPKGMYKQMGGPPLAPQSEQSRVITNYEVRATVEGVTGVQFEASWENILGKSSSGKQFQFIERHFKGIGQTKRDLTGATEYERSQIRRQIDSWVRESSKGMS